MCKSHARGPECFCCTARAVYDAKRVVAHHDNLHDGVNVDKCDECTACLDGVSKDEYVRMEVERERKRLKKTT